MNWEVGNPELDNTVVQTQHTLDSMPSNWVGFKLEEKAQILIDVIEDQMRLVRNGEFSMSNSQAVAALALEGQMCLYPLYADAEAQAKNAKHIAEYIEGEAANIIVAKASLKGEKRPPETALKRDSLLSEQVKMARKEAVDLEKHHKKWRCVMEIFKEAHVFFRRMSSD